MGHHGRSLGGSIKRAISGYQCAFTRPVLDATIDALTVGC
jgi:hypothetical protein